MLSWPAESLAQVVRVYARRPAGTPCFWQPSAQGDAGDSGDQARDQAEIRHLKLQICCFFCIFMADILG